MFSLYQRPVSRYGGYRLNLSFDRVLRVLALLEEPELDDADKVDLALRLLVMNKRKLLRLNLCKKWNSTRESCGTVSLINRILWQAGNQNASTLHRMRT